MDRREFLRHTGLSVVLAGVSAPGTGAEATPVADSMSGPPDHRLDIATALIELGPGHIVSTTAYNGSVPGPLLRLPAGRPVVVDIHNHTDIPEQVHWHGQFLPDRIDGAAEERTPFVPPHGMRREVFVPGPAGFRFYHTHLRAGPDLARGQYSGQVGPVYIEPEHEPGAHDREVFLTLKEFGPFFSRGGDEALDVLAPARAVPELEALGETAMREALARGLPHGYEVGYRLFAINGRMLGHGEPIRVRRGERVLLHVLNGSATEMRSLALPGHRFRVVALDGNPVANPTEVPVLWLGPAERISAIVEMTQPGVWVLGDLSDDDRVRGMGVVVEYAGAGGAPQWRAPPAFRWDYRLFSGPRVQAPVPDRVLDLTFSKSNAAAQGFNLWSINGASYDWDAMPVTWQLRRGGRYRLRMRNATDDIHPIHLHRHSFEVTRIGRESTAGIVKDVVMLAGYQTMEIDFTADQPGLTLFHCHSQLHMDYGFMGLFQCT